MPTRAELTELIQQGRTLEAIKRYREEHGVSLRVAKEAMYRLKGSVKPSPPMKPCPSCGRPLRTDLAQQCFECGADWHPKRRT